MRLLVLLSLSLLAACASTPAPLPAGQHVGEPLAVDQATVPLSTVQADPSSYFEQTLLVEATAEAVCQRAGCWMQISDGEETAMVRWETGCGGQYTFPADAVGQRVIIQGSFYPKTISPEDVEHLQEEAGEALEIEADGYELNATAVLVVDAD